MDVKFAAAARIAAEQNGRITTAQLATCGIGRSGIEKGVRAGRLHQVHRGVFAVGHLAPSVFGDAHAAVLAGGDGALLSVRWAARAARHPRRASARGSTSPSRRRVIGPAGDRVPSLRGAALRAGDVRATSRSPARHARWSTSRTTSATATRSSGH